MFIKGTRHVTQPVFEALPTQPLLTASERYLARDYDYRLSSEHIMLPVHGM